MRAQAMESLIRKMIKAHKNNNTQAMAQYVAKGEILLDRSADASVIRELVNGD